MISALLINDVPIECINRAAITYKVPVKLIISILETENGKSGAAIKNKNGTFDYGVMQINSVWLPKIEPYGYTANIIQYDACANVAVGTWILSQKLNESSTTWEAVGNYHSYTPRLNNSYQANVNTHFERIENLISHAFSK